MHEQYLLSVIATIFSSVALLLALEANRKFTYGGFKRFVEWCTLGIGYVFIYNFLGILTYMLSIAGIPALQNFLVSLSLFVAIITSICFSQAAVFLLHLSEVYGFENAPFAKKFAMKPKPQAVAGI